MADFNPTWDEIANGWAELLRQQAGIDKVFYPYPDNAVDTLDLPAVVINEATEQAFEPLTHGAFTLRYSGEISLLVIAIDTGQARLASGDVNRIMNAGLNLQLAVHGTRRIVGLITHVALGVGKIARMSPYDDDTRGHYAGLAIPYTLSMQYRS